MLMALMFFLFLQATQMFHLENPDLQLTFAWTWNLFLEQLQSKVIQALFQFWVDSMQLLFILILKAKAFISLALQLLFHFFQIEEYLIMENMVRILSLQVMDPLQPVHQIPVQEISRKVYFLIVSLKFLILVIFLIKILEPLLYKLPPLIFLLISQHLLELAIIIFQLVAFPHLLLF